MTVRQREDRVVAYLLNRAPEDYTWFGAVLETVQDGDWTP